MTVHTIGERLLVLLTVSIVCVLADAIDRYELERDGAIIATTPSLAFADERVAE